jgi:hypothetical protein
LYIHHSASVDGIPTQYKYPILPPLSINSAKISEMAIKKPSKPRALGLIETPVGLEKARLLG